MPYYAYTVAAIAVFIALFINYIRPRTIPGIPCLPDGHFLLGDIPRMAREAKNIGVGVPFLDKITKELGPVCQLRIGPFDHFVIVNDYAETESLLLRRHHSLDRATHSRRIFQTIIPRALIALKTDEVWKHHRRIIGPAVTNSHLARTTYKAVEAASDLIELWTEKSKVCQDRYSWFSEKDLEGATMDAICGMAFGQSWAINKTLTSQLKSTESNKLVYGEKGDAKFDLEGPEFAKAALYVLNSMPLETPFPVQRHFFTKLAPSYRRHSRLIDNYLNEKIKDARAKAEKLGAEIAVDTADNTLDMMVARELRGEDWMSEEDMKQELFLYLVAGTETTATTLVWWTKFMTNYPNVQRKLRDHLLTQLPELQDRPPSFDDLNPVKTPYLEAVVQETLRVARTAPGYTREAIEDLVILGHRVPKGTSIIFSTVQGLEDRSNPIAAVPWSDSITDEKGGDASIELAKSLENVRTDKTPRKAGFWAEGTGKDYDPERWLDREGNFDANAGPNLPFSAGQRGCFGKPLALLELRVFITQLILTFFFAPIPEEQNSFDQRYTITVHPKDCYVRLVSWSSPEAKAK